MSTSCTLIAREAFSKDAQMLLAKSFNKNGVCQGYMAGHHVYLLQASVLNNSLLLLLVSTSEMALA